MRIGRVLFLCALGGTMGAIAGHLFPEFRPWSPLTAGLIVGWIFTPWALEGE